MSTDVGRMRVDRPLPREAVQIGAGLLVIYVVRGSVFVAPGRA
jgi:hypothetical protein